MAGDLPRRNEVNPLVRMPAGKRSLIDVRQRVRAPALLAAPTVTVAIAATVLVVALARLSTATIHIAPTRTCMDIGAAQKPSDMDDLVARAIKVNTEDTNKALARIATSNRDGLDRTAAASASLEAGHADAVRALGMVSAFCSGKGCSRIATATQRATPLDDVIAKDDAATKRICGGT